MTCSSGRGPREGSASRPRLTVLEADGGSREVEVTAVSPTAFQAKWLVAAPRGSTVDLVGGAPAGAHSNTRWSTWRGDAAAVRELPQPFATFGGWGAGALVSLVQTPSAPVIVGSWESGGAGLDIAVWHPQGERWVRASSAGTALAEQPDRRWSSARGATADRDGVLVVGSVTLLGDGSVTQRPAVWRSPGPGRPVDAHRPARRRLPGRGTRGILRRLRPLHRRRCGRRALRGWTLAADGAASALGLPALAVGEHDLLPAPLLGGAQARPSCWPPAASLVVLTVSGGGEVDGTGRRAASTPGAARPEAPRRDGAIYVGARGPGGCGPPGPPQHAVTASAGRTA